jgi:hypothetical protein
MSQLRGKGTNGSRGVAIGVFELVLSRSSRLVGARYYLFNPIPAQEEIFVVEIVVGNKEEGF